MGKHERELIEKAEKIIIKILSQKISEADEKNRWFVHACYLAGTIHANFPKFDSVSHLGNRYDDTGDILLVSKGKKFFLEIKMSGTKKGIGTMANISQDALTDNHLFDGNIKSWSEFRENKKHDRWVNIYLNKYDNYPKNIFNVKNPAKKQEEKAEYLRKLSREGNKSAKVILDDIQKRDRKEKIDYLRYLGVKKQRPEMIKRFFILIALGVHKQEALKNLINKKNLLREIQNLLVYYANSHKGEIIIRREDVGKRITKIVGKYSDFKIIFPDDRTHCKIIGVKGKIRDPLLQVVYHWKNIAQGIKTPCLNIFDLTKKTD